MSAALPLGRPHRAVFELVAIIGALSAGRTGAAFAGFDRFKDLVRVVIDRANPARWAVVSTTGDAAPKPAREILRDHHKHHERTKSSHDRDEVDLDTSIARAKDDGVENADGFQTWFKHGLPPLLRATCAKKAAML